MTTAHSDAEGQPASNRLYYGDCLEVMDGFPSESADLIYLEHSSRRSARRDGARGMEGAATSRNRAYMPQHTGEPSSRRAQTR